MSAKTHDPEPGPLPVLFAPGLMCDGRLWADVRARLGAPSAVVAFDDCVTLEAMAAKILAEAPPRFLLAGFSMGGMAAVLAAAAAPERVAGLTILSTHGEVDDPARRRVRLDQIEQSHRLPFHDLIAHELIPAFLPDPSASARERLHQMATDQGVEIYRRHIRALIDRPDIGRVARGLTMPVVVMTGEHDRLAPPERALKLAGVIPRAAFQLVPDCGHMLPLERADIVSDAIHAMLSSLRPEAALP